MSQKIIVLDPGHGGDDPGTTVADPFFEKHVNLTITRFVRMMLDAVAACQAYRTVLTRHIDVPVGLAARARLANDTHALAFVSIHCNSADSATPCGYEFWIADGNEESRKLAQAIRARFRQTIPEPLDRGVKETTKLTVLNECESPAVLVECGFLSNPDEAKQLGSGIYQLRLACAITLGILSYLDCS